MTKNIKDKTMLKANKTETYYAISIRYEAKNKKIIAIICETDGLKQFEFIASFEKIVDKQITALLKKIKGYEFSAIELSELTESYSNVIIGSIKSILAENNIKSDEIDFICLENLNIAKNCNIDITSIIKNTLNTPTIYNISLEDSTNFLQVLANNKNIETQVIINLDDNFEVYKSNDKAHLIAESIGYSVMRYLSVYLNVEEDKIAFLASQGSADQAILNKLTKIEKIEELQKELINLIVFSPIETKDKLKTAFIVIKSLLLKNLAEFDTNTKIMLIGNTALIEELNQDLKDIFENIEFLKNQSQRQETLINEHMAYLAAKKHGSENYNNGVKLS